METDFAEERVFGRAQPKLLEAANDKILFMRVFGTIPPDREADVEIASAACPACGTRENVECWYGPAPYGASDGQEQWPVDDNWTDTAVAWCTLHGKVDEQMITNVPYGGFPT